MHYKGRKFIQVHSEAEYLIEKKIKINKISYYPIVCLIFKCKNSQEVQMTRNCQKVWLADAALERLETLLCISTDPGLIRHFIALGPYFVLRVKCSEVRIAALQPFSLLTCCIP